MTMVLEASVIMEHKLGFAQMMLLRPLHASPRCFSYFHILLPKRLSA